MHLIGTQIGTKEQIVSVGVVTIRNIKIRNNWAYFLGRVGNLGVPPKMTFYVCEQNTDIFLKIGDIFCIVYNIFIPR